MILDIAAMLCLFLLNGLFSMAEIAIVTARRARLLPMAERGHKGAEKALALNREPGLFLSSIQSGITLMGVLTGAIGGAAITDPLARYIATFEGLAAYAPDIAFALVVVVTSYVSLIIGELVPKQLALRYPERIASAAAPAMVFIAKITAPMVWVLDRSSRAVLRLIGVRGRRDNEVTEEEVTAMVAEGAEAGVFHPAESEMVSRVLRFTDRTARSIMTPRGDVVWFSETDDAGVVEGKISESGHSRFLLCPSGPEGLDHVLGVVHVRDLMLQMRHGGFDLKAICRPVPVVNDAMPVQEVLETLRARETRLAVVVDEYGTLEGIATMTDILEAVIGALPDMHGDGDVPVESVSEGIWMMEGSLAIEDAKMHLHLRELPGEDDITTLGGFVLHQLGRVPHVGDEVIYGGYEFRVIEMDGRRVDKVSVNKINFTD